MKTSITSLLLFVSFFSFAQTEEETILWLKEYGIPMLNHGKEIDNKANRIYYQNVRLENDIIISEYFSSNKEKTRSILRISKLNLNDLTFFYTEKEAKDWLGSLFFSKNCVLQQEKDLITNDLIFNGDNDRIWFSLSSSLSTEDKLRVLKAFTHLAKLKGAKPKPKVKKNTF